MALTLPEHVATLYDRLGKLEELVLAMAEVMAVKPVTYPYGVDTWAAAVQEREIIEAALGRRLDELKASRAARKEHDDEQRTDDQAE